MASSGPRNATSKRYGHDFGKATTGSPSEYATLKKEFIPGFLDTVSGWILQRVTIVK